MLKKNNMSNHKLTIGLFGFGIVGKGFYDIFKQREQGLDASIKKICVKDKNKKRILEESFFTVDKNELLNDADINLIVELINNVDEAYLIVKQALLNGKNVVTGNKKMLALHLEELIGLQKKTGASLLYEAAVCGSIPIIRTLEEYYKNELFYAVSGIFNGTSNYILSKIFNENLNYTQALKQAQELGFAESDPTSDVAGFDAMFKLIIIVSHAYGLIIKPEKILNFGIDTLEKTDVTYAKQRGYKLKLIPTVKRVQNELISLFVMPCFIKPDNFLFNVENEFNGVLVDVEFADSQFFYGKGAGGYPTGVAVLSDISAIAYNYCYEYKKINSTNQTKYTTAVTLKVYLRYNSEHLLKILNFIDFEEKFETKESRYVVGYLLLADIIDNKNHILNDKAFIALIGDEIKLAN